MPPTMVAPEDQTPSDLAFMDEALQMGEEALQAAEIPVGCVFVRSGRVIARGRNKTNEFRNACLHAEFDALYQLLPPLDPDPDGGGRRPAAADAYLRPPLDDVALYVTVEPCLMCASALRQVGIGKVYYGCSNDRFGGCGGVIPVNTDTRLVHHPPFVALGGYRREQAIMLLRRFYVTENVYAPAPKKKANRVLKQDIPALPL